MDLRDSASARNQVGRREARPQVDFWLWNGEQFMAREISDDQAMNEALMLVLGDGETASSGRKALQALRDRQLSEYLDRLGAATILRAPAPLHKRYDCISPGLHAVITAEAVDARRRRTHHASELRRGSRFEGETKEGARGLPPSLSAPTSR